MRVIDLSGALRSLCKTSRRDNNVTAAAPKGGVWCGIRVRAGGDTRPTRPVANGGGRRNLDATTACDSAGSSDLWSNLQLANRPLPAIVAHRRKRRRARFVKRRVASTAGSLHIALAA